MKSLTPHQQTMWDMYRPIDDGGQGLDRRQIADALNISPNNVGKTLGIIRKKLGLSLPHGSQKTEDKDPEKVEMILEAFSQPGITKEAAAKLLGYEGADHINAKTLARILAVYNAPFQAKKRVKLDELKAMLEDQLYRSARFLTDEKLAEASARDLAVAQAAWVEKLQLLKGQPTAIISDHERKGMNELGAALLIEMQRRGLTIEGQFKQVTSELSGA